jgi:hypothetical protein
LSQCNLLGTTSVLVCARENFKYHREFFRLFVKEQRPHNDKPYTYCRPTLHPFVVAWNAKKDERFSQKKRGVAAQCMHNVETWGLMLRATVFSQREAFSFILVLLPRIITKPAREHTDSGAATAFQHHFNSVRIFPTAFVDLQRFHHRYYQAAHAQGCAVCNQVMEGGEHTKNESSSNGAMG